jgi:hypothetical protein
MDFTNAGEFKVGNTTLSTPIRIRVPEYGHELPEIHSSSPIPMPMYTELRHIINWLDRGIDIDFCGSKENLEKVFYFILEYNRFVQEENKKIEDIDRQYRPALNAQDKLYRMIDYKSFIESKKARQEVPFKKNIYKGIPHNGEGIDATQSYKNPFFKRKNKPKGPLPQVPYEEPITPGEVHAYDIFAPLQDALAIEQSRFDDEDLN